MKGKDAGAIVSFFSWFFLESIPDTPKGVNVSAVRIEFSSQSYNLDVDTSVRNRIVITSYGIYDLCPRKHPFGSPGQMVFYQLENILLVSNNLNALFGHSNLNIEYSNLLINC